MTFSTLASPGVSLQGGGGSGGGAASLPISGNGATVTASTPLVDGTQTWNNAAVTFTGLKFNVTDTASNASSLLMDLQVGGSSRFSVSKAGLGAFKGQVASGFGYSFGNPQFYDSSISANSGFGIVNPSQSIIYGNSTAIIAFEDGANGIRINGSRLLGWVNGHATANVADTILTRRGTANLRLGAADTTGTTAPTPQFLSAQSWASSTTNNQTGANFTIDGSQGTGTGAGGSIIFRVAPAGGTSNGVQNALVDALTINSSSTIIQRGVGYNWHYKTTSNQLLTFEPNGAGIGGAVDANGFVAVNYSFTNNIGSSVDLILARDAANTLALRNGANAQLFRVYSTFNGTNDAYGAIGAAVNLDGTAGDANTLYIGSQKKGSPTALTKLAIQVDGTTRLDYGVTTASTWTTTSAFSAGAVTASIGGGLNINARSYITSDADGNFTLFNLAGSSFGLLKFGGTTSSFPALKRVSANLQVIAADGTSSAGLIVGNQALATAATDGFLYVPTCAGTPTGTPTTQTGTVPIVVDTTNNKLYFYSNAAWRDAGP
jgi:hypothetical protein